MSTTERRGRFITFEGGDGCGKTTQMKLLAERLRARGHEVVLSAEPGGTAIGRQIRAILLDSRNENLAPRAELLLYFASRAQAAGEIIVPALQRGAVVLSDRFTDSTLAYQGIGRSLGVEAVMTVHDVACPGLWPDLTICIDIDLLTSLERARARNERKSGPDERRIDEETVEFHERVRTYYHELAASDPARVKLIDGGDSIETVAERIWEVAS